ncbi:hypothetical protein LAG90_17385 [Marinilongibacter aquaticus]|uniref:hypothetical protein n=1 Tax=Marinilongibacter aquaticus TaxID=2975157 RepID=UPI0021BDA940|nr:hypothetical protein [Marinilongibacter aquaticus]UBM58578.1 hypothetical protein LAG90_17385 [Marinilongibacter aquaticus]
MTFEEYLINKKIDAKAFQQAEPERYAEWAYIFGQTHPESFTVQKKFLINPTRRKYTLKEG